VSTRYLARPSGASAENEAGGRHRRNGVRHGEGSQQLAYPAPERIGTGVVFGEPGATTRTSAPKRSHEGRVSVPAARSSESILMSPPRWRAVCSVTTMVFASHRDSSLESHEPAVAPRRLDQVAPPAVSRQEKRLFWRAVVHVVDRDTIRTMWHLAACHAPSEPAVHCLHGQRLLETVGDPDGHCLIDGQCGRCTSAR
jgi:hypothetical protein